MDLEKKNLYKIYAKKPTRSTLKKAKLCKIYASKRTQRENLHETIFEIFSLSSLVTTVFDKFAKIPRPRKR